MWLDVKIEAEETVLVTFFEIKSYKKSKISSLKQSLIDISNQLFTTRLLTIFYEEEEGEIKKLDLGPKEIILTTEVKSSLYQAVEISEILENFNEDLCVGDVFNYIERYLLLRLKKKTEDIKEKSLTMPSSMVSDSLTEISSTMPIRNLRVEPKMLKKNHAEASDFNKEPKKCFCLIL